MQTFLKRADISEVRDEILAIALYPGDQLPFPELTRQMRKDEFEAKPGQVYVLDTQGKSGLGFRKLLFYGLGEQKDLNLDFLRRFGGAAVRYAMQIRSPSVTIFSDVKGLPAVDSIQAICEGSVLASYKPIKFKTKKDDFSEVKSVCILASPQGTSASGSEAALARGVILAQAQNYVRDIDEDPANIATPQVLAEHAKRLAKTNKLCVKVLEKNELKRLKMAGILAVNQGSALPPVLVVLEYNKNQKDLPFYAVVGKGITFDSGGISIKPSKGMHEMKYDKTGAVVVLGVIKAASELSLPVRLVGVFAATENLPSGTAQKPGDIITAYNGKTIEILNTDAEGRVILADALAYTSEMKPDGIIDLATLTGAMIVGLGRHRIGLFSNDDTLSNAISAAGDRTFERVWRFPIDKEYKDMNKSDLADLKNIGSETGDAGSITAACFLSEFIGECNWAHLDIAGVDNISDRHPYLEKGASGIGVRLVCDALERLSKARNAR